MISHGHLLGQSVCGVGYALRPYKIVFLRGGRIVWFILMKLHAMGDHRGALSGSNCHCVSHDFCQSLTQCGELVWTIVGARVLAPQSL